jgi:hypothetical protein
MALRVRVYSRGYHDGSLYNYKIPLHKVMLDIMSDIADALGEVDFEKRVECDVDDDECFERAYQELGLEQDRAIDKVEGVLDRWSRKVQLPYVLWHINACDEYDACYYHVYLASIADLFRWWEAPTNRDVIIDALLTEYQFSIRDSDGLVYFDPRVRTSIHAIAIPSTAFEPLWYRGDLDRAIEAMKRILKSEVFGVPDDPDREVVWEYEVGLA